MNRMTVVRNSGWMVMVLAAMLVAASPAAASGIDGCAAADFNGNGVVDLLDASSLGAAAGTSCTDPKSPCQRHDLDGNGAVDTVDVTIFLDFFGQTCGACVADLDGDGNVDAQDRAILENAYNRECRPDLTRNGTVDQADSDVFQAYFGPAPPASAASRADFDGSGAVDLLDISVLTGALGNDCSVDLNRDGLVDTNDLWALLASWGACS